MLAKDCTRVGCALAADKAVNCCIWRLSRVQVLLSCSVAATSTPVMRPSLRSNALGLMAAWAARCAASTVVNKEGDQSSGLAPPPGFDTLHQTNASGATNSGDAWLLPICCSAVLTLSDARRTCIASAVSSGRLAKCWLR